MTTRLKVILFALAGLSFTCRAHADLLAYWHFNAPTNNLLIAYTNVSEGAGTLTVPASWDRASFDGVTNNALPSGIVSDPGSGMTNTAMVLRKDSDFNGSNLTFRISMANHKNLKMSLAVYKVNNSFTNILASDSVDGSTYGSLSNYNFGVWSTWRVQTFDFSPVSALKNAPQVYIRLTFTGATSNRVSDNCRIDNVQFNATALPPPGTTVLIR